MVELYRERGVQRTASNATFHLTPDWDGKFLKAFGLTGADPFHCWLVYDGRIIAELPENAPDFEARFLAAIDKRMGNKPQPMPQTKETP